jgi:hypothetical protein
MPNWKKVVVSGSNVSQLNNDGVYLRTIGDGIISSSAQLTSTFDTRYLNTTDDGVISSSAQIATDISGAFTAPSGGFSTRITSLETTVNSTTFSASIQERVTTLETDLNTLESKTLVSSSAQLTTEFDTRYLNTTGDGVISSSAQIATDISGAFTAPSSSISTRITSLEGGSGPNIYNSDGVVSANRTVLATDKTLLFQMSGSSQFLISDGPIVGPGQTWTMQVDSGGVYLDGLLPNTITSHIVGYNSVSTQLSYFPTSSINLTLDNVTDNGSTTTNGITIGGLTVNGNATITGTLTAQQFNTEFVSSSIIFESGSTKFGDSVDDIHSFTGSVKLNTETAATTDTDKFLVFDTGGQIKYRTGAEVLGDINPGGLISSSAQLTTEFDTRYLNTTGDGVISSSAQLTTEFDTRYLNTTGDNVISSSAQVTISSTTGYTSFSSSIAADIAALENAGYATVGTFASGANSESQRIGLWQDTSGTIGGLPGFEYDTANGILRLGSDRSIRGHSVNFTTGTVSLKIGSPASTYGAFISYTFQRNDASRSSFKAGNVTAAWNAAGTTVTFNETTTADIGTLTPLTVNVVLSSGDMYVQFTQTSGLSHTVYCNIDVMGLA